MKKYRLKEEAVPFFKDKLKNHIGDWTYWEDYNVDGKALEEVEDAYVEYGIKDKNGTGHLSGWSENNGAFIFEYGNNATYSFSEYTSGLAVNLKDSVSYQTKNSYNGSVITVGTANDTDTLTLGIIREKDSRLLKGAIYYFALYDKSLTPEEVEEEKVKLENYWEGGKNELA